MKLFFSKGACALGPQIILKELGLSFELESVNLKDKKTKSGSDFYKINPKGYIPALLLDDGSVLTEGAVILQYLADLKPEKNLFPKQGTAERYKAQEWLHYIATEIHKSFHNLFAADRLLKDSAAQEELKNSTRALLVKKFDFLDQHFAKNTFVLGSQFSICDAYLFNVTNWTKFTGVEISSFKNLMTFMEKVGAMPSVQKAIENEKQLS